MPNCKLKIIDAINVNSQYIAFDDQEATVQRVVDCANENPGLRYRTIFYGSYFVVLYTATRDLSERTITKAIKQFMKDNA